MIPDPTDFLETSSRRNAQAPGLVHPHRNSVRATLDS